MYRNVTEKLSSQPDATNCIACSKREPFPYCGKCLRNQINKLAAEAWGAGKYVNMRTAAPSQLRQAMHLSPQINLHSDMSKYTHAAARLLLDAANTPHGTAVMTDKWDQRSLEYAKSHASKWDMYFDANGTVLRHVSKYNIYDKDSMLQKLTQLGSSGASICSLVVEYDEAYMDLHACIQEGVVHTHENHVWSLAKPTKRHGNRKRHR